eukprot:CAMPEP_0197058370 /NCGR_PEP_ID=MMETSP1384-20130603/106989_1 /TAXON_ID=29189 /ORGANISM="Ammonia sp." /LENGTH=179 /DNA_ID=CAMNT_0042493097 /DNA_START=92 /DNA_END=631 /DNA_ORIENTATION=+
MPVPERYALLRKMTDVLVEYERLETTEAKAKALKVWIEPMVRWARRVKFHQTNDRGKFVLQHKMASRCEKEETLDKMFETMADRYKFRHHKDGFVRIVPTRRRYRDDAPMAFVEFIDRDGEIYKAKPQEPNEEWYRTKQYRPIQKYRERLRPQLLESEHAEDEYEDEEDDEEAKLEKLE